jgi:hypothetical protein
MSSKNFVLTADVRSLLEGAVKIMQSNGQVQASYRKTAADATTSMRSVEAAIRRAERASEAYSRQTVAMTRMQTGSRSVGLTSEQRGILRGTVVGPAERNLQDIAQQRRGLAIELRRQRSIASRDQLFQEIDFDRTLRMAAMNSRAVDSDSLSRLNAATIDLAARGGMRMPDDTALTRRARRNVARRVQQMGELSGKVTADEFDTMAEIEANRMTEALSLRTKILAGGALIGTAILGVAKKFLDDLSATAKALSDYQAGATGPQSLSQYRGNLRDFNKESIDWSNQFHLPVETVNDLRRNVAIVSGSDVKKEELDQLSLRAMRLNNATGWDPVASSSMVDNLRDVYPNLTAKDATNLMLDLRERGGLDLPQQEQVLPALLPAAQRFGVKPEELDALSAFVSENGGPEGANAKALRTTIMKLGELKKKGIIKGNGSTVDAFKQLDALQQRNPGLFNEALDDVGGNAGNMVHLIANNADKLDRNIKTSAERIYGEDLIPKIRKDLERDPQFLLAERQRKNETAEKNKELMKPLDQQQRSVNSQDVWRGADEAYRNSNWFVRNVGKLLVGGSWAVAEGMGVYRSPLGEIGRYEAQKQIPKGRTEAVWTSNASDEQQELQDAVIRLDQGLDAAPNLSANLQEKIQRMRQRANQEIRKGHWRLGLLNISLAQDALQTAAPQAMVRGVSDGDTGNLGNAAAHLRHAADELDRASRPRPGLPRYSNDPGAWLKP